jgi:hypothetical protein
MQIVLPSLAATIAPAIALADMLDDTVVVQLTGLPCTTDVGTEARTPLPPGFIAVTITRTV